MRTNCFGDPLYHNLGLGRHQGLADFPGNSHVEARDPRTVRFGYLGFLKHCLLGTGTEATTGTFSQVWVGMLTHFSASTFTEINQFRKTAEINEKITWNGDAFLSWNVGTDFLQKKTLRDNHRYVGDSLPLEYISHVYQC